VRKKERKREREIRRKGENKHAREREGEGRRENVCACRKVGWGVATFCEAQQHVKAML